MSGITLVRALRTRLFVTLILTTAGAGALAAQPSSQDERYLVTLQAAAAVDRGDAVAAQLAATHGGAIVPTGQPAEDTFVLRMSPSRVRVLAADPRVESVVPLRSVTANAVVEPVNWTGGVSYTYDGSGSITKIGDDVVSDAFVYDDVGRLVQAKVNGATRNYVYDAFGNRTACLHNGNTDCQYDLSINSSNNRIDDATYDPAGTGSVTAFGPHAYTYDAVNMMTSDHSGNGNFEYVYAADDERIATYTANTGGWEWTVRDTSGKVLREFASSNAGTSFGTSSWHWTRDYVWRDGLLLASRQAGVEGPTTHHYHLDHLGSARRVTDDDDHIIGYHDYYAFGPEISGSLQEPSRTDLKFTGHEREPGNDQYTLDYMHARFYNHTLGRFLSIDPANSADPLRPQTWNEYAYARNNPLSRIDPDGLTDIYSDPDDRGNVHRVIVNVWYDRDSVDLEPARGSTVRVRMEKSIDEARAFFARAGIRLDFQRHDVPAISDQGLENVAIMTDSGPVLFSEYAKSTPGLDIFVTQNQSSAGWTVGPGGPTLIGNRVNAGSVSDEMAHAFGNTRSLLPLANLWTDLWTDFNERAAARGKPLNELYQIMLRGGAREICADPKNCH
jgi:RHS repeat-associated protein